MSSREFSDAKSNATPKSGEHFYRSESGINWDPIGNEHRFQSETLYKQAENTASGNLSSEAMKLAERRYDVGAKITDFRMNGTNYEAVQHTETTRDGKDVGQPDVYKLGKNGSREKVTNSDEAKSVKDVLGKLEIDFGNSEKGRS